MLKDAVMSENEIWIVYTKSKILEGSPLDMDEADTLYGEVFVSVNSDFSGEKTDEVITRAKEALLKIKLELIEALKCIRYIQSEWLDGSEISDEINEAVAEVQNTGDIVFGVFRPTELPDMDD